MNFPGEMYRALDESYLQRSADRSAFVPAWGKITEAFPPVLSSIYTIDKLPSFQLARESGDLGLAVLWIVQAALIRSLVQVLHSRGLSLPQRVNPETIGSLAHSEDNRNPVTAVERGEHVVINGFKKYITGGLHSDFIFLTARKPGEEKISLLIHIPLELLPGEAMWELSIGTLTTTSHASLTLQDVRLPKSSVIPLEPSVIRKHLKVQGMIERGLIVQAYIGLLMYMAGKAEGIRDTLHREMETLLFDHNSSLAVQIDAAHAGASVTPVSTDIKGLSAIVNTIKKYFSACKDIQPPALIRRFDDLNLFSMFSA
ncbi:MAG TPA: hypothetical protein PLI62_01495 [Spirochaetota bacterium]|nr:hypothetical protein [Spirochaetota bacterium]